MSTGIRGHEALLHDHHHIFTRINASFGFSVSTYTHICLLLLKAERGGCRGGGGGGWLALFVCGGWWWWWVLCCCFGFVLLLLLLLFWVGYVVFFWGSRLFVCLFVLFVSFLLSFCSIVIVRIRNS